MLLLSDQTGKSRSRPLVFLLSFLSLGVVPLSSASDVVVDCDDASPGCYTRQMLGLWKKFRNDRRFDVQGLWDRMNVAHERWSTDTVNLWNVSDQFWRKYVQFGIDGGKPGDTWGGTGPFMEYDPTPLVRLSEIGNFPSIAPEAVNVEVLEPCNSVSNIALMRAAVCISENEQAKSWSLKTETMHGMMQAMTYAGPASFLMHSSGTFTGGDIDNESIHQVALVAHQGSLQSIPYDPVIHDLRNTSAVYSGNEAAQEACRIIVEEPIDNWLDLIRGLDTITYESSFMGILTTALYLTLPNGIASRLVSLFAGFLLSGNSLDFVLQQFTPALLQAFEDQNIKLGFLARFKLVISGLGIVVRVLYAFLWQEKLIPGGHLTSRTLNFLGAVGIGKINKLANILTGFNRRSDPDFQKSKHVYPGDRKCSRQQPHSKWHEVIGNGLVDVLLLSDRINRMISGRKHHFEIDNDLFRCYQSNDAFAAFSWTDIATQVSQVFEQCVGGFIESWPQLDFGVLTGCIVTTLISVGNNDEFDGAENGMNVDSSAFLETCLIENECIAFDGLALDAERLRQCIGQAPNSDPPQPCSLYVDQPGLSTCTATCGSGTWCFLDCLLQHSDVSSWVKQSVSCLAMLSGSDSLSPEIVGSCIQGLTADGGTTEFQSSVAHGLSSLAEVSRNTCNGPFGVFRKGAASAASCMNDCIRDASVGQDTTTTTTETKAMLPTLLVCSLECVAGLI